MRTKCLVSPTVRSKFFFKNFPLKHSMLINIFLKLYLETYIHCIRTSTKTPSFLPLHDCRSWVEIFA
jgi:hypothetical protein